MRLRFMPVKSGKRRERPQGLFLRQEKLCFRQVRVLCVVVGATQAIDTAPQICRDVVVSHVFEVGLRLCNSPCQGLETRRSHGLNVACHLIQEVELGLLSACLLS